MKAIWKTILEGATDEAVLAVDLYNQPMRARRLEGFFVHIHIAWLYLLQARFKRDGIDFRYRRANGRFERVDGEPRTWISNDVFWSVFRMMAPSERILSSPSVGVPLTAFLWLHAFPVG